MFVRLISTPNNTKQDDLYRQTSDISVAFVDN